MLKVLMLLVILCATCHVTLSFTDGLLANGGFESVPPALKTTDKREIQNIEIPEWEVIGSVEYVQSGQSQGGMLYVVPEGDFAIKLGKNSTIKQKVSVKKGKIYSITFGVSRTCGQNVYVNISVSPSSKFGDFGLLPVQTMYNSLGWDFYSWAFVAEADDVSISIQNPNILDEDHIDCGPIIDTIALKLLHIPNITAANMLRNGDFEEGPYIIPNTSVGVLIPPHIEDGHSPLPGWTIKSLKAVRYIDSDYFTLPGGKHAIELVGGRESSIVQNIPTFPGKNYTLSFSLGDANNKCEGNFSMEASMGRHKATVRYESKGTGGFERALIRFMAGSGQTRIGFLSNSYFMKNDHSGSLCGPVIDDVTLVESY